MAIMKKAKVASQGLASLELVERALHLLRHAPSAAHAAFWCGGVPHALALLFFWSDMSRGAMAETRLAEAALLVALAHLWMRVWQARACAVLTARLHGLAVPAWRPRDFLAEAGLQLRWGVWTWLLLPLAWLAMVPYAALHSFYQNLVAAPGNPRERVANARRLAALWPWQSHMLLLWFLLFRCIAFVEVVSCLLVLPWLAQLLFGIDHIALRYPLWFLNSTLLCLALVLTHLLIEPLVKTTHTLRCFHGAALSSGLDLLSEWRALRKKRGALEGAGRAVALPLLALLLACAPGGLAAHEAAAAAPQSARSAEAVSAARLDEALTIVMARPRFAWRMPREMNDKVSDNWLARQLRHLQVHLARLWEWMDEMMEKIFAWLGRRFNMAPRPSRPAERGIDPSTLIAIISLVCALLLSIVAILLWRGRRRRRAATLVKDVPAVTPPPDLEDESLTAAQLPEEEWLALAARWRGEGDLRRALRASFLALLARLGRLGHIRVQRAKSNRDYLRELLRRALGASAETERFAADIAIFERCWYGDHAVTERDLDRLRESVASWS